LPTAGFLIFFPMFSCRNFIVLAVIIRYIIYFKFHVCFFYGFRWGSRLISFRGYFQHYLQEILIFSHLITSLLLLDASSLHVWVSLLTIFSSFEWIF
jgi:hypothetical protein